MADITASMVKDLREKTGAGMMDCKTALNETSGDMEAAIDWLRAKGLAKAAKKAGRVAAEGLVGAVAEGARGAVIEVNSETDFVARNPTFQSMVSTIARLALDVGGDFEALKKAAYPETNRTVEEEIAHAIATIGENMTLRRSAGLSVSQGVVATYVHNQVAPGLGKIAILVALESQGDAGKLSEFGRQLAMHVAAANPLSVSVEDLDRDLIERERQVLSEQARESGKPESIIAKMVEGRLRKYYEEVVLLEQIWVLDGESRVSAMVEKAGKEAGGPVMVKGFIRFALGEGIERETTDFAAEVAAAAGR